MTCSSRAARSGWRASCSTRGRTSPTRSCSCPRPAASSPSATTAHVFDYAAAGRFPEPKEVREAVLAARGLAADAEAPLSLRARTLDRAGRARAPQPSRAAPASRTRGWKPRCCSRMRSASTVRTCIARLARTADACGAALRSARSLARRLRARAARVHRRVVASSTASTSSATRGRSSRGPRRRCSSTSRSARCGARRRWRCASSMSARVAARSPARSPCTRPPCADLAIDASAAALDARTPTMPSRSA